MLKPCWFKDHLGNPCKNGGITFDIFNKLVQSKIREYLVDFDLKDADLGRAGIDKQNRLIAEKEEMLRKDKNALSLINDAYENGDYKREEWLERKKKREDGINKTAKEIYELKKQLKAVPQNQASRGGEI